MQRFKFLLKHWKSLYLGLILSFSASYSFALCYPNTSKHNLPLSSGGCTVESNCPGCMEVFCASAPCVQVLVGCLADYLACIESIPLACTGTVVCT